MKLSAIEPACSKDINPILANRLIVEPIERQAASTALNIDNSSKTLEWGINNVQDRLSVDLDQLVNPNLPQANLSLAETIAAPPKTLEFEPDLSAENCQLEDIRASKQPVWFKILVIENDDLSRDCLSKMLCDRDTQVITAKESKAGIKLAQRECPDLIICELMMPKINGYGIEYFLQHSSLTDKIPLLFITTHTEQTDIDSETILIVDKNQIEPVTRAKLCDAIADKLILSTQV